MHHRLAGFAGLATARELTAKGVSALVLEARDRVGGRVLNEDLGGGQAIEVGGQWVGGGCGSRLRLPRGRLRDADGGGAGVLGGSR